MATVYNEDGGWVVKFKDGAGRWRKRRTTCATKGEAKRLAADLERTAERQQLGLEARPTDSTMTLAELCRWWLKKRYPTGGRNEYQRLELHVCAHALGAEPLPRVTSDRIEELLADVERGGAAPASLNRLRSSLHAAFSRARKAKVWTGPNPVSNVETRRVPKRIYNTLRAEEVPIFLSCVDAEWRNLFAAALWTGLRKGELCGLLKSDVDLPGRILLVSRSYDRDTTKGGHADAIPIAEPLVPYLEDAIRRSTSAYVFPAADGSMRTEEATPQRVLRAALVRAGLVEGWEHVCRRCKANGTPHTERHADSTLRRCNVCGMKMWPRAIPREMRFHCLRHSTATLLLRAKVDAHRVQRILRHASINTTLGTYGHLTVEDLREAVATLPTAPAFVEPHAATESPTASARGGAGRTTGGPNFSSHRVAARGSVSIGSGLPEWFRRDGKR